MIKEYTQDLRIPVKITHKKYNFKKKKNSHGRVSLTNAERLRANTCNTVSPFVFLALARLLLAVNIFLALPALFYTKMKNSKQKYSCTEFFFFSVF